MGRWAALLVLLLAGAERGSASQGAEGTGLVVYNHNVFPVLWNSTLTVELDEEKVLVPLVPCVLSRSTPNLCIADRILKSQYAASVFWRTVRQYCNVHPPFWPGPS